MKKGGNWIKGAIKKPGALRATAKKAGAMTSEGTIDKEWLRKKAKSKGVTGQRARLAQTLSRMRKGQMGMEMPQQPQQSQQKSTIPNYSPTRLGIMSLKMKKGGKMSLKSFLSGKSKKC